MIARRQFVRRLSRLLSGLLLVTGGMISAKPRKQSGGSKKDMEPASTQSPEAENHAADSTKSSSANDLKKSGAAKLKLWRISDTPEQLVQIRLLSASKSEADAISPIKVDPGSYQFGSYIEVPAGSANLEVSAEGQTTVLLPIRLADNSQSTLLVRKLGTALTAEWIDDTPSQTENHYDFCVYNLLPAGGEAQVVVGDILTAHLPPSTSNLRFSGLKKTNYPVIATGSTGGGRNFRWDGEVDFRQSHKITLMIHLDAYGRARPRLLAT